MGLLGSRITIREYQPTEEFDLNENEFKVLNDFDLSRYIDLIPCVGGKFKIRGKQFVGIIKTPNFTIYLEPKIGIDNVLKLLNYSKDFPELRSEAELKNVEEFIRFLIRIFSDKVQELYKKNYRKSYILKEESLKSIKGRICIKETLNIHKIRQDRVFCRYDDFTEDILHNRIIKFTLFVLPRILFSLGDKNDEKLYSMLTEIRNLYALFDSVSLKPISVDEIDSINYNRLDEEYKPVHKLCSLFIQNIFVSHKYGEHKMFSFLIDMNRLFEDFVREVFKRYSIFKVVGKPHNKYLDYEYSVKIKPDIILLGSGYNEILVVDCKYKKLEKMEDDDHNLQVINSDVYQILAYMVGYGLRFGTLIYPKEEIEEEKQLTINVSGNLYNVILKPIDLNRINDEFLNKFVKEVENIVQNTPVIAKINVVTQAAD